jgi:hypothetical protein
MNSYPETQSPLGIDFETSCFRSLAKRARVFQPDPAYLSITQACFHAKLRRVPLG